LQRCLHFSTFWYSSYYLKRVTTSKIEISTFDVVIILNAIGKFRTSKWCFSKNSFRCSEFTYGVTKDQNVESLLCQKTFRRSELTYGVTKDQNVESAIFDVLIVVVVINSKDIFDVVMSTFWSTKKTISTFWNFWPVDVLIVDVPTPSRFMKSFEGVYEVPPFSPFPLCASMITYCFRC
jgi:hypothetical protein